MGKQIISMILQLMRPNFDYSVCACVCVYDISHRMFAIMVRYRVQGIYMI